jgi:hypothetical protein
VTNLTKIRYIGPPITLEGHLVSNRNFVVKTDLVTNQILTAKIPHTKNGYSLITVECLCFPGCRADHFILEQG